MGDGPQKESLNLLLFYAAECGLKAVWLRRNKIRSTGLVDPGLLSAGGHDLMLWARNLHMPASVTGSKARFRLERDKDAVYDVAHAHQAWRYGVRIAVADEETIVAWLSALCQWVARENAL